MTLKQILLITFGMAATLLVAGCSREKFPDMPDDGGARPLRITVTDGGYAADDTGKNDTRVVEDGYVTEFTAGDACGLYIMRTGQVVAYDNVKLIATAGTDGILIWQPEKEVIFSGGYTGETYFLYYPYQPDMTDKINKRGTTSDANFFAPLISGWQPAADQSTYAQYTASDLMTAKGTATKNAADGKLLLTFSMTHRMAHAVIDAPKTVYRFTNTDVSISDYVVAPVDFTGSEVKPWRCGTDGTYHCIVKPAGGTATSITGSYRGEEKKDFAILANIAAGSYKRYVVEDAPVTTKEHLLQPGDYYLTDGHLLSKEATLTDEEKKKVIGIVFYAGHHENDISDYSQSGIALTKCHGYVVALDDVSKGCAWGANRVFGCNNGTLSKDDWNGYEWTRKIIDYVEGVDNLGTTAAGYPATYYAVVKNGETYPINGGSGWFLPSSGQMWNIYENQGALFTSLGSTLKSFEGAPFKSYVGYWSSSEPSTTYYAFTLGIRANETEAGIYTSSKSSSRSIRSVLAF